MGGAESPRGPVTSNVLLPACYCCPPRINGAAALHLHRLLAAFPPPASVQCGVVPSVAAHQSHSPTHPAIAPRAALGPIGDVKGVGGCGWGPKGAPSLKRPTPPPTPRRLAPQTPKHTELPWPPPSFPLTSRSSGYRLSSSSMATPSSASRERSLPSSCSEMGWSLPYTSPDASCVGEAKGEEEGGTR